MSDPRTEIVDLVSSLGRLIDERRFDDIRTLFTPDGSVSTPGGDAVGHDAVVAQAARRHSQHDATQHVITNVLVDIDGDRASARANLLVTFADDNVALPYQAGGVYRFELQHTTGGWLFTTVVTTPVWSVNEPAA
ncbi:nuclear transport factor 2 family protein [Acidothermaceae bacterium B102]|nr:nuclear transport factor 2 family protein [Acidothermaceae bacterium B102]